MDPDPHSDSRPRRNSDRGSHADPGQHYGRGYNDKAPPPPTRHNRWIARYQCGRSLSFDTVQIQDVNKFVTDQDPGQTLIQIWIHAKTIQQKRIKYQENL